MDGKKGHGPVSRPASLTELWRALRAERHRRRALEDIVAKPHDHWLEDAGITREEARRILRQSALHRIAFWAGLRGRGR